MQANYTVAMIQMRVHGGQPDANMKNAIAAIAEAARLGCKLAVLPECLDLGWTHPSAMEIAGPIPGTRSDAIAQAGAAHGIYVVAGLVEKTNDRTYNAAILVDPSGRIRLHYRKINELDIGLTFYHVGDRLGVAETELGTLGINICADNFPGSLAIGHVLARMGAQIILSPCAWAVDADHDNEKTPYGGPWREAYGELARLYGITILGVSSVGTLDAGPWRGKKLIGCSLAMGPEGRVIAQGPYGEDAEAVIPVPVGLRDPIGRGTEIAEALAAKGYQGP